MWKTCHHLLYHQHTHLSSRYVKFSSDSSSEGISRCKGLWRLLWHGVTKTDYYDERKHSKAIRIPISTDKVPTVTPYIPYGTSRSAGSCVIGDGPAQPERGALRTGSVVDFTNDCMAGSVKAWTTLFHLNKPSISSIYLHKENI
jgi:hypothetical protein